MKRAIPVCLVFVMFLFFMAPSEASFPGPNGRIVFLSGGSLDSEILSMKPDGSDVQTLTDNSVSEESPCWSPNGSKIAYSDFSDGNLYVMRYDGTNPVQVTTNGPGNRNPCWSPDGKKLVFVRIVGGHSVVFKTNSDGSGHRKRLTQLARDSYDPVWSVTGRIAYDQDGHIFTMKPDGTGKKRVTNGPIDDIEADWSPNGKRIAFIGIKNDNFDIYTVRADGTNRVKVTHSADDEDRSAWSPNGRWLVFDIQRANPAECDVIKMKRDGTHRVTLTADLPDCNYWADWGTRQGP